MGISLDQLDALPDKPSKTVSLQQLDALPDKPNPQGGYGWIGQHLFDSSPEQPQQKLSNGNPLTRSLEVGGSMVKAPFKMIKDLATTAGGAVINHPIKSLETTAKTGYALSPVGFGQTAVQGLFNKNNWVGEKQERKPGNVEDIQNAAAFALAKTGRDIGQGILSAPSDLNNVGNYIATGNRTPQTKPLFNLPDLNDEAKKTMADNPLSSFIGQALPYIVGSELGASKIEKGTKFIETENGIQKVPTRLANFAQNNKAATDSVVGGIMGAATESPSQDPVQRISDRTAMLGLAGVTAGASRILKSGVETVDNAIKVDSVKNLFGVDKATAQTYVNGTNNFNDFYNTSKQMILDLQRTMSKQFNLAPEDTAHVVKQSLINGAKDRITQNLTGQGYSLEDATKIYEDYNKERGAATTYEARVAADRKLLKQLNAKGTNTTGLNDLVAPTRYKNMKSSIKANAVKTIMDMTGMSEEDALNLSNTPSNLVSLFGDSNHFSVRQTLFSRMGLLPSSELGTSTKLGGKIQQVLIDNIPVYHEAISSIRNNLNDVKDRMIQSIIGDNMHPLIAGNPVTMDVMQNILNFQKNYVDNGIVADMLKGDFSRVSPEVAQRLTPIVDELKSINENTIIPLMRRIYGMKDFKDLTLDDFKKGIIANNLAEPNFVDRYAETQYNKYKKGKMTKEDAAKLGAYVDFDPTHISNSQRADMVHYWNLDELKKILPVDEFENFVNKWNVRGEDVLSDGEKLNKTIETPHGEVDAEDLQQEKRPMVLFGYYDTPADLIKHLENNISRYSKDFPFLFDENGKVKTNLISSEINLSKILADLDFQKKLLTPQFYEFKNREKLFGLKLGDQLGFTKEQVKQMLGEIDDSFLAGNLNLSGDTYRRFIGSLMKNENKLTTFNVDPFDVYYKQYIDLAKRHYIGPVINELRAGQQAIKEMLVAPENNKSFNIKARLEAEQYYYKDLESMFRNTPTKIDSWVSDMYNTIKDLAPDSVKNIMNVVGKRKNLDTYLQLETALKIGLNMTGGLLHLYESARYGASDLLSWDNVGKMLQDMGVHHENDEMFLNQLNKFFLDSIQEVKQHPAAGMILSGKEYGADLPSGFVPNRIFGSRTLGSVRDVIMTPFQAGANIGKLLQFKIYKSIGEGKGLSGKVLNDFITNELSKSGTISELSEIPLAKRTLLLKPVSLFQTFIVRLLNSEMRYWGKVLDNPTPDNISKATIFSLAPVALMGAGASPTFTLALSAVNAVNGAFNKNNGVEDPMDLLESNRAKNGFFSQGYLGKYTNFDTSLIHSNLTHTFSQIGSVQSNEIQSLAKFASDIYQIQANRLGYEESKDLLWNETVNALKRNITSVNRISNAYDIVKTGEIHSSKGNTIFKLAPGENKYVTALGFLTGVKDKRKIQQVLANEKLNEGVQKFENQNKFIRNNIKEEVTKDSSNPEKFNDLSRAYTDLNPGKGLPLDTIKQWEMEKYNTVLQNKWNSLPKEQQEYLKKDKTIRRILEINGIDTEEKTNEQ